MTVRLVSFRSELTVLGLEVESARVLKRKFTSIQERKSVRCSGFGDRLNRKVVAVYEIGGELWFQYGRVRVRLLPGDAVFSWKRLNRLLNRFVVASGGDDILAISYYSAFLNPINFLNPTFDELDEELSDFPLWLYRADQEPGWRTNALNGWRKGI